MKEKKSMNKKTAKASIKIDSEKNGKKLKDYTPEEKTEVIEDALKPFNQIIAEITELANNSDDFKKIINQILEENAELLPFIKAELRRVKKEPEYNNLTIWDILDAKENQNPEEPKSKASLILERAIERQKIDKEKRKNAKTREKLPQVVNSIILNDAVSHAIVKKPVFEDKNDAGIIRGYSVNQGNKKQPVNVAFVLTYKGDDIKLSKPSNAYDYAFENALCSISETVRQQNNGIFTPFIVTDAEIYRVMTGTQNDKRTPTPEQKKRVAATMQKTRFTDVIGDISEEIKKYNLFIDDERIIGGQIKDYRINATPITFISEKGRVIDAYRINTEPIMLSYNRLKGGEHGHLLYIPLDYLDTEDNDGNTIEIRNYLLTQILYMLHEPKRNKKILFETMYQSGVEAPEVRINQENTRTEKSKDAIKSKQTYQANIRKARAKDRERVKRILDNWIKKGFIKGYKEIKEKTAFVGVEIITNPNALKAKNEK